MHPHHRSKAAARSWIAGLIFVSALAGCNSAQVIRSNLERSAQNEGKPKPQAWPAHPYAPATSSRPSPFGDNRPLQMGEGLDDEVIQAAAQSPPAHSHRTMQQRGHAAAISGRVIDSSGRPQPGVSIIATPTRRPPGPRVETVSDAFGNYVLRGVESGQRYLILASATRAPTALIGRVSANSHDQNVVIQIARPFTANRTRRSHPDDSTPPLGSETPETPMADSSNSFSTSQRRSGYRNPFASDEYNQPPSATPPATNRKSRSDIAAENRLESPWDMPGPPTQPTTPATKRLGGLGNRINSEATTPDHGWKPVLGSKHDPENSPIPPPRLEPQSGPASRDYDPAQNIGEGEERIVSRQSNPALPLSQPQNVRVVPTPNIPSATLTQVMPRSDVMENNAPRNSQDAKFSGAACQFDGDRLVEFELLDIGDRPVRFSQIKGRLVLLDFWGTWCGYCLKSIPRLTELQTRYGPQGLQVLGIAYEQGDTAERVTRVRQVGEQLKVNYPLLLGDGDGKCPVRDKFGIHFYPTLVLIDRAGNVLWKSEGPDEKDLQQLEKLLKSQLAGSPTGYN